MLAYALDGDLYCHILWGSNILTPGRDEIPLLCIQDCNQMAPYEQHVRQQQVMSDDQDLQNTTHKTLAGFVSDTERKEYATLGRPWARDLLKQELKQRQKSNKCLLCQHF